MKRIQITLKNWIDTDRGDFIRTLLITAGFGFCFCAAQIAGLCLDRMGSVSAHMSAWLGMSLAATCILSAVYMILWAGFRSSHRDGAPSGHPHNIPFLVVWIAIFAAWIPVWLAFYPGLPTYDAESQIAQIITGQYSTHHPLLHTLWMGICVWGLYDIAGMNGAVATYCLIQMLIMSGIFAWIIREAGRAGAPRWLLWIYGIWAALMPVNSILAISTTKDVVFAGILVVMALGLRRIDGNASRREIIITGALGALAIALRNNAVYALALVLLILALKRMRGRTVALAAGIMAGLALSFILRLATGAESGSPREALSIPIQQMAAVDALRRAELDAEDAAALDQILTPEAGTLYNPHLADPVKREVDMHSPRLFVSTWLRLGLRYPGVYLDAWLYTTEGAWYIADTSHSEIYGYGYGTGFGYLSTDTRPMPPGFEISRREWLLPLRSALEHLVNGNAYMNIPVVRVLFAPALYVWILIMCTYVAIIRRQRDFSCFSGVLGAYLLTLLLGPAILVRYMYPFMMAPGILILYPSSSRVSKSESMDPKNKR